MAKFGQEYFYSNLDVKTNEDLKKHVSLFVGGPAKYYVEPKTVKELLDAIEFAKLTGGYKIIGNGTNILPSDNLINKTIICTKKINGIFIKEEKATLMCGAGINKSINELAERSLSGLEYLVDIPASIGGAIVMNAGAYGHNISDCLYSVSVIKNGKLKKYYKSDCSFKYRESSFKNKKEIIISADFVFTKCNKEEILKRISEYKQKRKDAFPSGKSCGSVFKNPNGNSAGKIIDSLGLKGFAIGDAEISDKHANFIINKGNASAKDINDLIEIIKKKAKKDLNVDLTEEVEKIGEFK